MKKSLFVITTFIFLVFLRLFVNELNFNGSRAELMFSLGVAFEANTLTMLIYLIIIITVGTIMLALFSDIVRGYFKKRNHKYYRSLATVTPILYVTYILALITTSASNLGPMIFGGVLALWIAVYQGDEESET